MLCLGRKPQEKTEAETQAILERAGKALESIHKDYERKRSLYGATDPKTNAGRVICPNCDDGIVNYHVYHYSGRIKAKCTTAGCVRFDV